MHRRECKRLSRRSEFRLSDFDRKFQQKRDELNKIGEVIATFPTRKAKRLNSGSFMRRRPVFIAIVHQAMRAGQAVAEVTGKNVEFSIHVDGSFGCDALADPLMHLVRNAVDHGIESNGRITSTQQKPGSQ
jgi:chemotaxis protein histidine kinase CheA